MWPLNESEYQKTLQELRAFAQCLHFGLSIDGCLLLTRNSADVEIMERQLESVKILQKLESETANLQYTVKNQTLTIQDDLFERKREKVLTWISKFDHDQKHRILQSSRVEDTGGWLLRRQEYTKWQHDISTPNILWCHGDQGTGKTVLAYVETEILMFLKANVAQISHH